MTTPCSHIPTIKTKNGDLVVRVTTGHKVLFQEGDKEAVDFMAFNAPEMSQTGLSSRASSSR